MPTEAQEIAEQLSTKFDQFKAKHNDRLDLIEQEVIDMAKTAKRPAR
jgi:hypothetical protein